MSSASPKVPFKLLKDRHHNPKPRVVIFIMHWCLFQHTQFWWILERQASSEKTDRKSCNSVCICFCGDYLLCRVRPLTKYTWTDKCVRDAEDGEWKTSYMSYNRKEIYHLAIESILGDNLLLSSIVTQPPKVHLQVYLAWTVICEQKSPDSAKLWWTMSSDDQIETINTLWTLAVSLKIRQTVSNKDTFKYTLYQSMYISKITWSWFQYPQKRLCEVWHKGWWKPSAVGPVLLVVLQPAIVGLQAVLSLPGAR